MVARQRLRGRRIGSKLSKLPRQLGRLSLVAQGAGDLDALSDGLDMRRVEPQSLLVELACLTVAQLGAAHQRQVVVRQRQGWSSRMASVKRWRAFSSWPWRRHASPAVLWRLATRGATLIAASASWAASTNFSLA